MNDITEKIQGLKKKTGAVILAHNYQPPEVQDLGDFCGDSLELSRKAAECDAEVIIFCGVDFMAETAKLLSPEKKVILPAPGATCPMADMITAEDLKGFKKRYPDAAVVTYVNSTAEVKALSDVCCTSSNAVKIVNSVKQDEVIFTPDRNLAHYVSLNTDKKIIPWPGFCPIHESISPEDVSAAREKHPEAVFMAHPECRARVLELADYVASTGQMFNVVEKESCRSFIVGTEEGMVYPLSRRFPEREFFPVRAGALCPNMKKTTLLQVFKALKDLSPEITVPASVAGPARASLEKMLKLS